MSASRTKQKPVIAIDFDGVIHDIKNPLEGKRMGAPIDGAKEALTKMSNKFRIIVFSARPDRKVIEEWLIFHRIPYNDITNIKPQALAYVDDKGIRFTTWREVTDTIATMFLLK